MELAKCILCLGIWWVASISCLAGNKVGLTEAYRAVGCMVHCM
jgi:hypothetical protein